jgi:hypothetical protein
VNGNKISTPLQLTLMKKLLLLVCFALSASASVEGQPNPRVGTNDSPTVDLPADPGLDVEPATRTSVYPNPSSGQFSVKLFGFKDEKVAVNILDKSGRVVATHTSRQRDTGGMFTFNLTDNAPGIYVVNIKTTEGIQSKQIRIIQ